MLHSLIFLDKAYFYCALAIIILAFGTLLCLLASFGVVSARQKELISEQKARIDYLNRPSDASELSRLQLLAKDRKIEIIQKQLNSAKESLSGALTTIKIQEGIIENLTIKN